MIEKSFIVLLHLLTFKLQVERTGQLILYIFIDLFFRDINPSGISLFHTRLLLNIKTKKIKYFRPHLNLDCAHFKTDSFITENYKYLLQPPRLLETQMYFYCVCVFY